MNSLCRFVAVVVLVCYGCLDLATSQPLIPAGPGPVVLPWECPDVTGPAPTALFSARATWYEPQLGACELLPTGPGSDFTGAINNAQWDNPARSCQSVWCGKCILVNATDFDTSVVVMLVDHASGPEMLLSTAAWSVMLGDRAQEAFDAGQINVNYNLVTCPIILESKSRGKR